MAVHAVIMAGGKGERLWPLSTPDNPKQLHSFGTAESLLRSTFERTLAIADSSRIYVVTNMQIADKVREHLPEIPGENVLAEPVGRNTAPCIAYAALVIARKDPDAVMAVFPADHWISDRQGFTAAIGFGIEALRDHPRLLITLGMVPDHPETGYGYIAPGEVVARGPSHCLHRVLTFREKPDLKTAETYIEKGFLWNAGMFLWRVDTILDAFRVHLPGMHALLSAMNERPQIRDQNVREFYDRVEAVSIDYGVMEKASDVGVIPAEFGWNDIGSWDALGRIVPGDKFGNTVNGGVLLEDAAGNVVWATRKKIVLLGVNDLVVVEGKDAILVCPRSRSQDVSRLARLVSEDREKT
ncbi:MAG: mannose-1-phosphate guanylyltransferase [Desulfomonilia bacterium]